VASSRSQSRIEARIIERVAHCCQFELKDPRAAFVTITGCTVTADLSIASVTYTVMGDDSDKSKVAHMLEHATGFVRKQVGRVLKTRRIPELRWRYDDSVDFQIKMEDAISAALAGDKLVNPSAHPAPPEVIVIEEEFDDPEDEDDEAPESAENDGELDSDK
jgi:ribosome-binding factor A